MNSIPLFPKCLPKLTDRAWFDVDHPCVHEDEVAQLEKEYQDWVIYSVKVVLVVCTDTDVLVNMKLYCSSSATTR